VGIFPSLALNLNPNPSSPSSISHLLLGIVQYHGVSSSTVQYHFLFLETCKASKFSVVRDPSPLPQT
jgi:hypothetical protein